LPKRYWAFTLLHIPPGSAKRFSPSVALPAEIAMTDVDDALPMPGSRIFADHEIEVPRRCSRRDRIAERCDAEESYPTPAEILVRVGALLLIFLWIASAADCLVDALGG
jgi:hypothetical protein